MRWWWSTATARSRPRARRIVHGQRRSRSARCTACPSPSRRRSTSRGCTRLVQPPAAQGQCRGRGCGSLVARLRAAGAVILGKTNVPELCADFQTDSPLFGTSKNAWDDRRTAGGSTGGGGGGRRRAPVAARAGQRHRRLGAQSGALQRHLFAEAHGVARARPRPRAGPARPDPHRPLDGRVRPLARSVEDLETALRIIAGPDGYEAEARARAAGTGAGRQPQGPAHRRSSTAIRW